MGIQDVLGLSIFNDCVRFKPNGEQDLNVDIQTSSVLKWMFMLLGVWAGCHSINTVEHGIW